ncbi:imm11 family protein [Achromobacter sp. DH1f]|uniref:imm11 family protein n=1 Tax=Achromobacter sp. DH1f TaxID=1397275 RepID=UPI0006914CBE
MDASRLASAKSTPLAATTEATVTEPTATEISAAAASQKGEFFLIDASFLSNGGIPGIEIANEEKLIQPGMHVVSRPDGTPNQYPERPHLVHVPGKGAMPRDLEEFAGIWVVSEPLKRLFEQMDAEAFAFVACDFSLADGSPGPQYYLGNVLRRIDALDEASSRVRIKLDHNDQTGEEEKLYSLVGGASLVFRRDVVGDAHIFRQDRMGAPPICDRAMFDALRAANFSGVRLRDVADL